MSIKVVIKEAQGWSKRERKQLVFPVLDAAGQPVDVTTWSARWALMTRAGASSALVERVTGTANITVEDGGTGIPHIYIVTIDPALMVNVRAGVEYYEELMRTDVPNLLAYGPVTLLP